ncbi:MAG: ComEC/Rec2 family competence protein, partial [Microbacteriaceae bacterium]
LAVPLGWPAVGACLVFIGLGLAVLKRFNLLRWFDVAIAGCLILAGFGLTSWQNQSQSAPPSASVVQIAKNFEIRHLHLDVKNVSGHRVEVRARLDHEEFNAQTFLTQPITPGDLIEGDFRVTLRDSVHGVVLKPQGPLTFERHPPSAIERLRDGFTGAANGVSADARALVLGLSIGDDRDLSVMTKDRMQTLSLTHLTAVSGANCAIVLAGAYFLLARFRIPRSFRLTICLLVLVTYVLLVGPEPSVLRAALMSGVVSAGLMAGRKVPAVVGLAAATYLSLLVWPNLATSLGFALSVASTAAILFLAPRIYERLKPKFGKTLALALAVSLSAQLWCLPLLIDLQGGIPTYSVLANLLAEPLVAPITVLGLLAVSVSPFAPQLSLVLTWLASLFAELIVKISEIAELPVPTIWWPSGFFGLTLISLLAVLLTLTLVSKKRWPLFGTVCIIMVWTFGGVSQAAEYAKWPLKNWQIISCDVGQGDATVVRDGGAIAVIDVGRDPEPIDKCLKRIGISNISMLVLTHFDADHVGGLSGALRGRTVEQAFISPFEDQRPLATASVEMLRRVDAKINLPSCCQGGKFGSSAWRVIQPEPRAVGSEDSNDASLVLRFDLPGMILFTLADQGERGQMRMVQNHFELLQNPESKPVVVKVSHHGSADQYQELYEFLRPAVSLVSVGVRNPYGHPTKRTLDLLSRIGSQVVRTDLVGGVAVGVSDRGLTVGVEHGG